MKFSLKAVFLIAVVGFGSVAGKKGTCGQNDYMNCLKHLWKAVGTAHGTAHTIPDLKAACLSVQTTKNCLNAIKPSCSKDIWERITKNLHKQGINLEASVTECCNTIGNFQKNCVDVKMHSATFSVSSPTDCKSLEKTWTCFGKYDVNLKKQCKATKFATIPIIWKRGIAGNLNACEHNGIHIAVDYKNAGVRERATYIIPCKNTGDIRREFRKARQEGAFSTDSQAQIHSALTLALSTFIITVYNFRG